MLDRRNFFRSGWTDLLREFMRTPFGDVMDRQLHALSNLLAPEWLDKQIESALGPLARPVPSHGNRETGEHPSLLPHEERESEQERVYSRPPGALENPNKFNKACTRCNDCIIACPHGVIFHLGPHSGPVLDTNLYACHLCKDWPCIRACDTGALQPLPADFYPKFGQAVLTAESCLNTPEHRAAIHGDKKRAPYCRACVKACPVPEAVSLSKEKLPVFEEHCTGCGLCVQVCPANPVALRIAPE